MEREQEVGTTYYSGTQTLLFANICKYNLVITMIHVSDGVFVSFHFYFTRVIFNFFKVFNNIQTLEFLVPSSCLTFKYFLGSREPLKNINTSAECNIKCLNDPQCNYWTHDQEGDGITPTCTLFTDKMICHNPGFSISGPKCQISGH